MTDEVVVADGDGDQLVLFDSGDLLLVSETGPTGPTGERGLTGPAGDKGEQGEVGPSGPVTFPDGGRAVWTRDTDPGELAMDGDIWVGP